MENLNDLIDPSLGISLTRAEDINDSGQIVCQGGGTDSNLHSYLLTPVPEPSTLVLLGIGAIGLLAGMRACRRISRA